MQIVARCPDKLLSEKRREEVLRQVVTSWVSQSISGKSFGSVSMQNHHNSQVNCIPYMEVSFIEYIVAMILQSHVCSCHNQK